MTLAFGIEVGLLAGAGRAGGPCEGFLLAFGMGGLVAMVAALLPVARGTRMKWFAWAIVAGAVVWAPGFVVGINDERILEGQGAIVLLSISLGILALFTLTMSIRPLREGGRHRSVAVDARAVLTVRPVDYRIGQPTRVIINIDDQLTNNATICKRESPPRRAIVLQT